MKLYSVFYIDEELGIYDLIGTFSSYEVASDCILNNLSHRGITDEEDIDYEINVYYSILTNELDKEMKLELGA